MRLNLGIRRRLAPLLDHNLQKILLAYSLLFTLPGSPVIYYGDEIGMGDNILLPDRNGVRTPMQWNSGPNAGFSRAAKLYAPIIDDPLYSTQSTNVVDQCADQSSLWHALQGIIAIHKQHPALACGELTWLDCGTTTVAAYLRIYENERLLVLNNLSASMQEISCSVPGGVRGSIQDLLNNQIAGDLNGKLSMSLRPYEYRWLLIQ